MTAGRRSIRAASLLAALTLLMLGALYVAGPSPVAGAQSDPPPTTLVPVDEQPQLKSPSIIPLPNSGDGKVDPGDPGSGAQYAVLGLTVAGMVVVALLIRRESNRKRDQRTPMPD